MKEKSCGLSPKWKAISKLTNTCAKNELKISQIELFQKNDFEQK